MSLYRHPKSGHLVCAERGIVYQKDCREGLKPLAMTISKVGYLVVPTGTRKSRYTSTVHRMVWEAVNGKLVPKGMEIHHRNSSKTDNRISNLQLVTRSENAKAAASLKRARKQAAALTPAQALEIWESDGHVSADDWSTALGVDPQTVEHVRKGGVVDISSSVAAEIGARYAKH